MNSTLSCDENVTCHYPWWLGLIVTFDMEFFQWWHGYHLYLHYSSNFNCLCLYPPKGILSNGIFRVLWSSWLQCVLHSFHVSFVFFSLLYLPRVFFPCCFWNTYIWNHSWKATIGRKISSPTMFIVYFMFTPFQCTQKGENELLSA